MALCERTDLLGGADEQMFIDIDSLLRPVYGHAKQGASYGHTKIAGKQILRKGLSPLATTISTAGSAPVIAGLRLPAGRANSAKGAARMVAQAISTARAISAHTTILVRGDSAFGSRAVVGMCLRHGAQFSVAMARNSAIDKAIAAIGQDAWTPVRYPGAVRDPDTGAWISDAQVAEIGYPAFASTPDAITARPIVRRVKDARYPDALFPVWRHHPFFTNTDAPSSRPTSPTATTPSSQPYLPTSSTDPWPICPRDASAPTPPGSCARRSPTTCCMPPQCSPATNTPGHGDRRYAAGLSPSRPGWPDLSADRSCTCPPTGPGRNIGLHYGTRRFARGSTMPIPAKR